MQQENEHQHWIERADLVRIVLAACAAATTWFHLWQPMSRIDLFAVAALIACGWPIWREALEALRERRMTMELSMAIAIGATAALGELFTALVIVLFVLVAEVLEGLTVSRGRKAIQQLVDLLPRSAVVRRGGSEQEVAAGDLRVDEVIMVRPGARIPVDGVVVSGHSFVDQAAITGESMPVQKLASARVFAGIDAAGLRRTRRAAGGRDRGEALRTPLGQSNPSQRRGRTVCRRAGGFPLSTGTRHLLPSRGPADPRRQSRAARAAFGGGRDDSAAGGR